MSRFSQILTKPKLLRLIIGHVLRITGLCRHIKIRYNGLLIRFNPTAYSLNLWVYGEANKEDIDFIQSYLRPGDTFLDIGSNIGILTITASQVVGNSGQVYSVEAHPITYQYLVDNLSLNKCDHVIHYHTALGKENGQLSFTSDARLDDQNRASTQQQAGDIIVPLKRLDDLIKTDRINLLKIDVEGFEPEVFAGAVATLKNTDCIYFESWEKHLQQYGYSTMSVIHQLQQAGFSVCKYQHSGKQIIKLPHGYISQECENLVAIKNIDDFIARTQLNLS